MRPDQPHGMASLGTACVNPSRAGAVLNIARRVVKLSKKYDPSSVYGFGIRDNVLQCIHLYRTAESDAWPRKTARPCHINVDTTTTPLRSMESACHTPIEQRARATQRRGHLTRQPRSEQHRLQGQHPLHTPLDNQPPTEPARCAIQLARNIVARISERGIEFATSI